MKALGKIEVEIKNKRKHTLITYKTLQMKRKIKHLVSIECQNKTST
jgi:hypothetical protein